MANVKQQLDNPALPSLGLSGAVYSQDVQNQNNGILRLFFTKVVNVLGSLIGPSGGKYLNFPYGAFHNETDQAALSTTDAYPVFFPNTDYANGVSITSDSRITVAVDGIWNLQFSLQIKNVSNDGQDFDIWFRKNGVNIPNSNSRFHVAARKSTGDASHIVAALNFIESLSAGDYIEIVGRVTSLDVTLEAFPASTSPTRPAIPSAIATMTFVSNLPNQ
jgi:hypothetical protein